MVRNHAWWRGEPEVIRTLLPGVRAVIDAHLFHVAPKGLLKSLRGWNFLDWMVEWKDGIPPGGDPGGVSGPFNWLFVYALQAAIELETFVGEPEMAERYTRLARDHAFATERAFWNKERGLFADDMEHRSFSEHTQCLAILGGWATPARASLAGSGLLKSPGLIRCTYYFSHYLFEALRKISATDSIFDRFQQWYDLPAQGFVTTPECSEPSRSDCHAWGSHPLFHIFATILGIRPSAMGFAQVEIRPKLGPLEFISGRMVHPSGWIEANLKRARARIEGTIELPEGVTGHFFGTKGTQVLSPGSQHVSA